MLTQYSASNPTSKDNLSIPIAIYCDFFQYFTAVYNSSILMNAMFCTALSGCFCVSLQFATICNVSSLYTILNVVTVLRIILLRDFFTFYQLIYCYCPRGIMVNSLSSSENMRFGCLHNSLVCHPFKLLSRRTVSKQWKI